MTGQNVIDKALVELASEGTRSLNTGKTLQTELLDALNTVLQELPSRWVFGWLLNNVPSAVATIDGTFRYSIPSPLFELDAIVLDTGAIDTRKLKKRPIRKFRQEWANMLYLPKDKPTHWAQTGDAKFDVAPIPNAVYTMQLTGSQFPPTINASGGTAPTVVTDLGSLSVPIPARYHDYIHWGVAALGASKLQDRELAGKMLAMWERSINIMIAEDKRDPDVEYELQPFRASGGGAESTKYWASPFIRSVE